ncbi:uncharacterized protein LOC18443609 [Amborella trichopoda]|uniref:Survival protein SurE-like phosphatase/nucleotidase domain-containing protein n=1 Tax=Amborella trichopoda TaxID=13333 RepID=U5CZB3_AMBTC|nr:uncharacterized protein LOC18443609 [Amborella trichopoda]ERN15325.1 hypothetical protein AMTR_s00036p00106140 [Amborella trichopoda]|eukprot:XP_006853858.1 uncharacterized protein LOC18443609 [Amborella trichopoda]
MTSVKNSYLPPTLVSNLQDVLMSRKGGGEGSAAVEGESASMEEEVGESEKLGSKPIVLVTNGDGIGAPGLTSLVEALVLGGRCSVHVCAPESDKSVSGHSVTLRETLTVSSVEINGATAFEVSGTPADCISLALSGALFSWSKPVLVISGVNKGSSCGHHIFYSGAVAGAREALISGVPSLAISLNWKKDESQESDFKEAVNVCLPLIHAALRDIEKGVFPKDCALSIEVPTCPSANKGFKVARQSLWRSAPSWQAVSGNRHPSGGHFMSKHQSLGIQLAQLSRDASAVGAARRINSQRKTVEIESVAEAGKPEPRRGAIKKYFRVEFSDKEQDDQNEDLDFRALESGFIAVTPLRLTSNDGLEANNLALEWLDRAFAPDA